MNTITSLHWNTFPLRKQIQLIEEKFRGNKFVAAFGHPVTSLPGIHTLTMLRTLRIATLEVLENRQSCTVYRIRQTGTVFCSKNEMDVLYKDYQEYLNNQSDSPLLHLFDSKEIVYTLRTEGYVDYIERHKSPRFSGTIEITDNATLDGPAEKHIDITNLTWIDPAPTTQKEFSTVMKKTILFIRANFPAAKDNAPNKANKLNAYYRFEEPNEKIIYGPSGTGKSLLAEHGKPQHYTNQKENDMNIYIQSIQFIQAYRKMEKGTQKYAKTIIAQLSDHHQHEHLLSAWKGKENNFGDWFLNLSHSTQGEIIRIFGQGLDDQTIDNYILQKKSDPVATLWLDPPPLVKRYHELLKFFYNHGINEEPATGVRLPAIPANDKCYGNSENWGEYILSLNPTQQQHVIGQILSYLNDDGEPKNFPQPFNPSKEDFRNAAKALAKHLSPKYALSDPDTGEHLAKGERTATPDQETP